MTIRIDPHTAEPGFYWARDPDGEWTVLQFHEEDGFLSLGSDLCLTVIEVAADWHLVAKIEPPTGETS